MTKILLPLVVCASLAAHAELRVVVCDPLLHNTAGGLGLGSVPGSVDEVITGSPVKGLPAGWVGQSGRNAFTANLVVAPLWGYDIGCWP